jgi:hypothetical protein
MDVLTAAEIKGITSRSPLVRKYNEEIDRKSAYEILEKKMEAATKAEHKAEMAEQQAKANKTSTRSRGREKSIFEQIMNNTTTRQIGRTVAREFTRGLLGILGVKSRR